MRNFILGLVLGLIVMGLVSLMTIKEEQQKPVLTASSTADMGTETVTSTESVSTEASSTQHTSYIHEFSNALPAMISEVATSGEYILADIVERNPRWLPGGSESFYLNKVVKKEKLLIVDQTETYACGAGVDGNDTSPDVRVKISDYLQGIRNYFAEEKEAARLGYAGHSDSPMYSSRMLFTEGTVLAMYNQCLP